MVVKLEGASPSRESLSSLQLPGAPRGLEPFEVETELDLVPTGDNVVMQKVSIQHGSIKLADAMGATKKGEEQSESYFFGYVLAAGPGRRTSDGTLLPMSCAQGDFVKVVGRAYKHHTPSHRVVWIASADTVVGVFRPARQ